MRKHKREMRRHSLQSIFACGFLSRRQSRQSGARDWNIVSGKMDARLALRIIRLSVRERALDHHHCFASRTHTRARNGAKSMAARARARTRARGRSAQIGDLRGICSSPTSVGDEERKQQFARVPHFLSRLLVIGGLRARSSSA